MRSLASIAWQTSGQGLRIVAVLCHEMTRACCHLRSWERCTYRRMSRQESNQEILCPFINVYCLYSTYQPWFELLGDTTGNRASEVKAFLLALFCLWGACTANRTLEEPGSGSRGGSWGRSFWSTYWKSRLGRWLGVVTQMIRKSKSCQRLKTGCSNQTEDYKQGPEGSEHNN